MRFTESVSLLLAATGTQVAAQSFSSTSAAPSSTAAPGGSETSELGNATVVGNNPVGVVYKATLPESAFFKPAYPDGGNIKGEVTATANSDGKGVLFTVKLSNLPKIGAALPYHIHVDPVPSDGNCTATLGHLDPFIRGETPPCNKEAPETCQVGDLSGKHGTIPTDNDVWETSYVDLYASTLEGIGAFFGNRSIVIHYPNKTRITCASFEKVKGGTPVPTGGSNSTVSQPPPPTTSSVVVGAASSLRVEAVGAVILGAAIMYML